MTHAGSFIGFGSFLDRLLPAIKCYPAPCKLLIVNNSGIDEANKTIEIVENSELNNVCETLVIPSPENNIATGRNLVLHNTDTELLAFIDDDEYPTQHWLTEIVATMLDWRCVAVAGPAIPVYEAPSSRWIKSVDLHSANGKKTGDKLVTCASANVLIDLSKTRNRQFDPEFGRSGGEDAHYFMSIVKEGGEVRWCNEATVYETIPMNKSTSRYMLKRFMIQGEIHKRILKKNGDIHSMLLFNLRSFVVFLAAFPIGIALALAGRPSAGNWIRRSFGNLGKLVSLPASLY
ncbi:MAG: glycosyltransferase family 2 protein [Granulosicoccus sp.]|nr:glycosyltransferase family 2 protein [Granulosicoccus sp.]